MNYSILTLEQTYYQNEELLLLQIQPMKIGYVVCVCVSICVRLSFSVIRNL